MTVWLREGQKAGPEGSSGGRERCEHLVDTEHGRLGEGRYASYSDSSRSYLGFEEGERRIRLHI